MFKRIARIAALMSFVLGTSLTPACQERVEEPPPQQEVPYRPLWPAVRTPPSSLADFADACRALGGASVEIHDQDEGIWCAPTDEPPLALLRSPLADGDASGKPTLLNLAPWRASSSDAPAAWPKPPLTLEGLHAEAEPDGGVRLTGLLTHEDAVPWIALLLLLHAPDPSSEGGAATQSRCIQGAVSSSKPFKPKQSKALSCRLPAGPLADEARAGRLWATVGFARQGEAADRVFARLYPMAVRFSAPIDDGPLVIVSPGRAYGGLQNGRPCAPFALSKALVAESVGQEKSYARLEPRPARNGVPATFMAALRSGSGRAQVVYRFARYAPAPSRLPADLRAWYEPDADPAALPAGLLPRMVPGGRAVRGAAPLGIETGRGARPLLAVGLTLDDGSWTLDWWGLPTTSDPEAASR